MERGCLCPRGDFLPHFGNQHRVVIGYLALQFLNISLNLPIKREADEKIGDTENDSEHEEEDDTIGEKDFVLERWISQCVPEILLLFHIFVSRQTQMS